MAEGQNGQKETPEDESGSQNGENGLLDGDESFEQLVHEASNEYIDLTNTMDQIDKWMTDIEEKNDSLVSKLKDLLESNKQIRAEIQMENQMAGHSIEDKENPSTSQSPEDKQEGKDSGS